MISIQLIRFFDNSNRKLSALFFFDALFFLTKRESKLLVFVKAHFHFMLKSYKFFG